MTNETLKQVLQLYKNNKLIPFIGAGFSKRFELPTMPELIVMIAENLGWDPDVFKANGESFQLMEYYSLKKGSGALRSFLDKKFSVSEAKIRKSKAHMLLPKLKFSSIYTTNFDEIIEESFRLQSVEYDLITDIAGFANASDQKTKIIKFHGTFNDDKTLVLTDTNYFQRLGFEDAMDIQLRADILSNTLLFIGYSFKDINVRYMLHKFKKIRADNNIPAAFLVTFSSNEVQRLLLENTNVQLIELNPIDKDKSMDDFLGRFLK